MRCSAVTGTGWAAGGAARGGGDVDLDALGVMLALNRIDAEQQREADAQEELALVLVAVELVVGGVGDVGLVGVVDVLVADSGVIFGQSTRQS